MKLKQLSELEEQKVALFGIICVNSSQVSKKKHILERGPTKYVTIFANYDNLICI